MRLETDDGEDVEVFDGDPDADLPATRDGAQDDLSDVPEGEAPEGEAPEDDDA